MSGILRTASATDLVALWSAINASRLFDSPEALRLWCETEPWRVRVSDSGEAVVLDRWREHLDLLQMRGIWCHAPRLGDVLADLRETAAEHGFAGLLSPLLQEPAAGPYLRSGMRVEQRLVAFCARPGALENTAVPAGVVLREATDEDLPVVEFIDESAFEPFWRYGRVKLAEAFGSGRAVVAVSGDDVVGYTLTTVSRGVGTLACLAVRPDARRRGIGRALLSDAASRMATGGATSLSLCTQESNATSRALYSSAGLRELPDAFLLLAADTVPDPAGRTMGASGVASGAHSEGPPS